MASRILSGTGAWQKIADLGNCIACYFVMFQPDVLRYFSLRLECDSFMLSVVEERRKPPHTLGCVIHYLGMMGLSNCCQTILTLMNL